MFLAKSPLVAAVAQMVEHVIRNDGVGGSSPFSGTSSLNYVQSNETFLASQECHRKIETSSKMLCLGLINH